MRAIRKQGGDREIQKINMRCGTAIVCRCANRSGQHHLVRQRSERKGQQQLFISDDRLQDYQACHRAGAFG